MARTTSARKTSTSTPVKKTAAKKTAARAPRKATAKKPQPRLSPVKDPSALLPTRRRPWMTDVQGHATLAARIAGITTPRIRDWRDHRNGTATRPLADGSHLHYNLATRTLTWQATCPMGAIHEYELTSPSVAAAARVHADRCTQTHADLSTIQPLTGDELEALGFLHTPTWAHKDLLGEQPTESIPIPLSAQRPRTLADQLARAKSATADTQPLSTDEITAGLAARVAADNDQPKEHPEP